MLRIETERLILRDYTPECPRQAVTLLGKQVISRCNIDHYR